jgi:hypothetical protein
VHDKRKRHFHAAPHERSSHDVWVAGVRSLLIQLGCAGVVLAAATWLVGPSHPDRESIVWLALMVPGYAVSYLLALTRGPLVRLSLILLSPLAFLLGYAVLGSLGAAGYDSACEGGSVPREPPPGRARGARLARHGARRHRGLDPRLLRARSAGG